MSVNGKPDEGDVYLDDDGYFVCHLKNTSGCWYKLFLSSDNAGASMFLSGANADTHAFGKHVLNIKDMLLTIRKELQDESSS